MHAINYVSILAEPANMKFFTQHPESVGETYWQHMGVALSFAFALFGAAFAALTHAFLPACFEKTASLKITELHDRIICNRRKQNPNTDAAFEAKISEDAR
jgi:hypothetical protein